MAYIEGNSGAPASRSPESPPFVDAGLAGVVLIGGAAATEFIPEHSYLRYFAAAALLLASAKIFYDIDRAGDWH